MLAPVRNRHDGRGVFGDGEGPCRRAGRWGAEPDEWGKLFERNERRLVMPTRCLPRRFRGLAAGVVSATGLPFLLILFFGQAKKRMLLPQGGYVWLIEKKVCNGFGLRRARWKLFCPFFV